MNKTTKEKTFVKQKGKWTIFEMLKNGHPFKLIVEGMKEGKIKQIIEKPNLKEMEKSISTSGLHVIVDFPERNHYDYYEGGKKVSMKKTKDNTYRTSGGTLII